MESILGSVKKVLGIDPGYTAFDEDIILDINTAFSNLYQLGIGPSDGFEINDTNAVWDDFLGAGGDKTFNSVKSFIVLTVRLLFDPPATSFAIQSMQSQIEELGWRLNVRREEVEHPWTPPPLVIE